MVRQGDSGGAIFFSDGVFFICQRGGKPYNSFVFNKFHSLSGGNAKWKRKKNLTDMN